MTNPTILLDLDGTIADSRPGIIASLRAALRDLRHSPAPDEDFTWAVGPPLPEVWRRLMTQYGDDRVDFGMARYREHYGLTGLSGWRHAFSASMAAFPMARWMTKPTLSLISCGARA